MMTTQKNSVYFPDELFSIIKEFAGIYDMRCPNSNMDKRLIMNSYILMCVDNPYAITTNAKWSKKEILSNIYRNKWSLETANKIQTFCKSNTTHLSIGDEIVSSLISDTNSNEDCAIITKINDYTIQIKRYKLSPTIHYYPANENDTQVVNLGYGGLSMFVRDSETGLTKPINRYGIVGDIPQDQLVWEVQYYDKTTFNRAKTYCPNSIRPVVNKTINNFTPLWNSGSGDMMLPNDRVFYPKYDLSNFVCYKRLIYNGVY